jgi:2-(1,2-epoxy-1,2-dihydrophenyl)acetyl-CoA isomerase
MDPENAVATEVLISDAAVLLTLHTHVGHIHLNRPASANGLDNDTLAAFRAALTACHGDSRVRVVLLTGEGKNFCAGGNVKTFLDQGTNLPYYIRQATIALQEVINLMIHLDAPIVTAVQGFAAGGGGMGIVCASDIVFAAENASFLAGATRVGMAPDAGLSVTLPRLIGARKASQMLLSNNTVKAEEALAIGLVNKLAPAADLLAVAMAEAQALSEAAPRALAATKRLLWTGVGLGVDAAMPEEARTVADLCRTNDAQEGMKAVVEKRKPNFTGS